MNELIFISGRQKGRHVPLDGRRLTLGRERANDITIGDEAVSRYHAEIFWTGGKPHLRDFNSTNGTYVNDKRIGECELHSGDRIGLGDTTALVNLALPESDSQGTVVMREEEERGKLVARVSYDAVSSQLLQAEPQADQQAVAGSFLQIYDYMVEVSAVLQLPRLLELTMEHLFKATHADRGFILLLNAAGELEPVIVRSRTGQMHTETSMSISRGMTHHVLERGESLLSYDAAHDERFSRSASISQLQINSVICAPLKVKDKMLGLIYLDTLGGEPPFTETELKLLTATAVQTAVSIENARLYEELLDSMEYTSSVLRSLSSGIIVVDASGRITRLNEAALVTLNKREGELLGQDLGTFEEYKELAKVLQQTLRTGVPYDRREVVIRVDGREMPIGLGTSVLEDHAGKVRGAIANFRNIANIKRLAEQVKRNQHLASLGEMAAGVAHEIRNPLNSIRGFAQLLAEKKADEETQEFTGIIVEEVDRMNAIVQDLLDFSRPKPLTLVEADLRPLLEKTAQEMKKEAEAGGVEIVLNVADPLPRALVSPPKLQQVLINLIRNGLQAMERGGTLTVRAAAASHSETGAREIRLAVADTGCGIPDNILPRIFDPFFTSREVGMGLGLSICGRIIEQHGGRIEVETEVGKGSTFTVCLPALETSGG